MNGTYVLRPNEIAKAVINPACWWSNTAAAGPAAPSGLEGGKSGSSTVHYVNQPSYSANPGEAANAWTGTPTQIVLVALCFS